MNNLTRGPLHEVRHSSIHGHGVFAIRKIRKGTTLIEYTGERVSHKVADARYEGKNPDDNHTFLFTVDDRIVIDGGAGGNEARFINHSCNPNCESSIVNRRVYISAIKTIQPDEELSYDYSIQRDADDEPDVDEVFACRCGTPACRGSMLEPRREPKRRVATAAAQSTRKRTRRSRTHVEPRRQSAGR